MSIFRAFCIAGLFTPCFTPALATTCDPELQGYSYLYPLIAFGFCSSGKPTHYQYNYQQLTLNTHQSLGKLGIQKATRPCSA